MPELPELEVVCEVLEKRVVGQRITNVTLLQPGAAIVVRDLTGDGFVESLAGRAFASVHRRGKFLVLAFEGQPALCVVLNLKLTGRLQLAIPGDKRRSKTHVIFALENGIQLRYLDQKQMGQL
jgi:formamidopyrimidine-DNA glycosylase